MRKLQKTLSFNAEHVQPAELLGVFLIYSACLLLFFFPAFSSLNHSIIGPPEDNMQFYWFIWHGSTSLLKNHNLAMHSSLIYYPWGVDLFYANYFYYGVALAAILRPFFSLPLIFNLLVLHTFVAAGVAFFVLAKRITQEFWPSLLGGFVFAFNPSHFSHSLHHVTIASIQFIPLFVLFLMKAVRSGKTQDSLWGALFLVLSALCDWNYLVFGLVFVVLCYGYLGISDRKLFAVKTLKAIFLVPFFTFVALSPLIVPMIRIGLTSTFKRHLDGHDIYVADVAGFFIPHVSHLLATVPWIQTINVKLSGTDWEKAVYLGWANLFLIGLAFRSASKRELKYVWGLLVFMLFAMGSHLHFLGKKLPIVLPYKLLEIAPLLTNARNPSRIMVFGYLFLAVLVALSFKMFLKKKGAIRYFFAAALVLVIFFDYYSTAGRLTPVELPKAYEAVTRDRIQDFAILELPWDGARYMMYQTLHGAPDVQGYIGRRVENTFGDSLSYDLADLSGQKKSLIEHKVKYIILHKKRLDWDPKKTKDILYYFRLVQAAKIYGQTYEKIYEDRDAATFRVYA